MKPIDRQKMCTNCDGRIPLDVYQCPYCFMQLPVENQNQGGLFKQQNNSENASSLYPPPYATKFSADHEEKKGMYKTVSASVDKDPVASLNQLESEEKQVFWPILLLSLAGNLLTLGLLQFFFSERGVVHLEISASYWFLLILLSVPLFYLGFKQTKPQA